MILINPIFSEWKSSVLEVMIPMMYHTWVWVTSKSLKSVLLVGVESELDNMKLILYFLQQIWASMLNLFWFNKVSPRKYVYFFYYGSYSKCIQIFWDSLYFIFVLHSLPPCMFKNIKCDFWSFQKITSPAQHNTDIV